MLDIVNATKTFSKGTVNEHTALDHLSLHLEPGEFVTIIGSNGAGKSTLFNAICGSFYLDEGSIELDGKNISYQKEHRRAKAIGRLFQDPQKGTAPDLTIEEHLALVYSKAKRGPFSIALQKKDRSFFRDTLAQLDMGLEDRMKTKVGLLSGGQRQALTLLLSTLIPPKLLLLDEHTAALDPLTAQKVLELTREITAQHAITTLMITHNIASALSMGTRTIMLESGKIVLDLQGEERKNMSVSGLLETYRSVTKQDLDNDRMLLSNP